MPFYNGRICKKEELWYMLNPSFLSLIVMAIKEGDLESRVTTIPNGSENPADETSELPVALPRVPTLPGEESDGLSETGESTLVAAVSEVRVQSGAVLGFGEIVLPPGQGPDDDDENEEQQAISEEHPPVPLNPEFVEAIKEYFGNNLDEVTKFEAFLILEGYPVKIVHNGIHINASFELGEVDPFNVEVQPSLEELHKDIQEVINLRDALLHFEYVVTQRGLSLEGYYEHTMFKKVVFDSKASVLQEIQELKEALEEVLAKNSGRDRDSDVPQT